MNLSSTCRIIKTRGLMGSTGRKREGQKNEETMDAASHFTGWERKPRNQRPTAIRDSRADTWRCGRSREGWNTWERCPVGRRGPEGRWAERRTTQERSEGRGESTDVKTDHLQTPTITPGGHSCRQKEQSLDQYRPPLSHLVDTPVGRKSKA